MPAAVLSLISIDARVMIKHRGRSPPLLASVRLHRSPRPPRRRRTGRCAGRGIDELPVEVVIARCTAVLNAAPARDRKLIAHFNRGVAYQRLVWLSSAIADYTEVLKLRPNGWRTLSNRGRGLCR